MKFMEHKQKNKNRKSVLLILGILLCTGLVATMLSTVAYGDVVTYRKIATHTHDWYWGNAKIGDTYLEVDWTYRRYFIGHHIVYSEIVSYDSVYVAEKGRITISETSTKGVDPIDAPHQYRAWGKTTWTLDVGISHKKAATYTARYFTDYGSYWRDDKWIQYP